MPFIEVTEGERPSLVNIDQILEVHPSGNGARIVQAGGVITSTAESYATVRLAIERIHRIVVPSQICMSPLQTVARSVSA